MNHFEALKIELERLCPGLELRQEEPMSKHTSFRIGGPVKLMAFPASEGEVAQAVQAAMGLGIEPLFIGNGSNLLVADRGLDAFVIKCGKGLGTIEKVNDTCLRLGAGTLLSQAAAFARQESLTGLEFAHGIPGSVGGAVMMNAGAYNGEIANVVESVRFLGLDGSLREIVGEKLGFSYRKSVFEDLDGIILSAVVCLQPGDPVKIAARIDDLAFRRRERQPLELPSAGSTFKRPKDGFAAALIDQCGLKGCRVGNAQVSEKHAGFVVNLGNATCADVMGVISHVYRVVLEQTGVALEPEVRLLGVEAWNL